MLVIHLQHSDQDAALRSARNLYTSQVLCSGGVHPDLEFRVRVIFFVARPLCDGQLHGFEHDYHDQRVILSFQHAVVICVGSFVQHRWGITLALHGLQLGPVRFPVQDS